jgi:hypothetical protein
MIQQVLTFGSDVNVSLQVGDIVYYSPTATTGGFSTVNNASSIVTFGVVTAIYNDGDPTLSIPVYSIVVLYDDTTVSLPSPSDYIMFSKNTQRNGDVAGYYAKAKFVNDSKEKIELFSIGSEVSESSK